MFDESGHIWPTWKRVRIKEINDERSPIGGISPLFPELGVSKDTPLSALTDELLVVLDIEMHLFDYSQSCYYRSVIAVSTIEDNGVTRYEFSEVGSGHVDFSYGVPMGLMLNVVTRRFCSEDRIGQELSVILRVDWDKKGTS